MSLNILFSSLQIDDVDVHRCREGRLDYLGTISFTLIAIPMTFLLMHEVGGGAIISAVLPSLYGGLMILGASLYAISLVALLAPYCVVFGLLCYFVFLYKSSILAHSARQAERMQLSREGTAILYAPRHLIRSKAAVTRHDGVKHKFTFVGALKHFIRVCRIVQHTFQGGVTFFSHNRIDLYLAKLRNDQLAWRAMNMPYNLQGNYTPYVPVVEPDPQIRGKCVTFDPSIVIRAPPAFVPPPGISNMISSAKEASVIIQSKASTDFSKILSSKQKPILIKGKPQGSRKLARQRSLIHYDAEEALAVMKRKLSPPPASGRKSRKDPNVMLLEVSAADLTDAFSEILEKFYPNGVKLRSSEKGEAHKLFYQWRTELNLRIDVSREGDATVETSMASFPLFESWFSSDFVNAIRVMHEKREEGIEEEEDDDGTASNNPMHRVYEKVMKKTELIIPSHGSPGKSVLPSPLRSALKGGSSSLNTTAASSAVSSPSVDSQQTARSSRIWP